VGAIRLLIVTVFMGGLAYWLLHTVIQGARTGRVRHTDSVKSCSKTENPLGYWLLMALFAGMAGIAISVWVYVAISVFRPRG
jgi:hypothetical protein